MPDPRPPTTPGQTGTLRISHVITRLIVGGAQENTLASVIGLRARFGHRVELLSGPTTGPEGSLESEAQLHPGLLHTLPALTRPIHPWRDLLALRQLTRHFQRHRPQIVHTHSGKAGILGRLAAHRSQVPLIIHTIHGPSFGSFQNQASNLLFRNAERLAARYTHHFVVVANAMRDQYLAAGIGTPHQYTRIFSGFPITPHLNATPDPALQSQLGLLPGDFVVGMIARLFRLKGHDDLIDAAPSLVRSCPRIRFLLVGDGRWRTRLQQRVAQLGLTNRFVFAGLVPPDHIPAYTALMDVLVHLSRREGLARALPQALAAGKPIVAADCDGAREICLHGETGFLIPPGRQESLVQAVSQLAQSPALRSRLGQRGQQLVRHWFPVETMVEELNALYGRLLPGPGPASTPSPQPHPRSPH